MGGGVLFGTHRGLVADDGGGVDGHDLVVLDRQVVPLLLQMRHLPQSVRIVGGRGREGEAWGMARTSPIFYPKAL